MNRFGNSSDLDSLNILFKVLVEKATPLAKKPEKLDMKECQQNNDIFDFHSELIENFVQDLSRFDNRKKIKYLFEYVRDEVKYSFAPPLEGEKDWKASVILEKGVGFCHQKAILLSTLLRAAGFPSALVFQNLTDHVLNNSRYRQIFPDGELPLHGLSAVFVESQWYRLDATLDRELCEKENYHLVNFSSGKDLLLPEVTKDGKPHFELRYEIGFFQDYPLFFRDAILDRLSIWKLWEDYVHRTNITM